jgi:predicted nucleotide-binding protein
MSRFFISRAGEDAGIANWVAAILEDARHTVTIQNRDFLLGHHFLHEMSESLANVDHTIAILSPSYIAKLYTLLEMYTTRVRDPV